MTLTSVEKRPRHALIGAPDVEHVDPAAYLDVPTTEALELIFETPKTITVRPPRRVKYAPVPAKAHVAIQQEALMEEAAMETVVTFPRFRRPKFTIWPSISKTPQLSKFERRVIPITATLGALSAALAVWTAVVLQT